MTDVLPVDGSFGEGGGQIIRSSLALSLVTGRPFVMDNIRAGRKRPGLMRQHLTAVGAAAEVGRAEVEGATLGSRRLMFMPGDVTPGNYHFRVGTAGSATLVAQTILPAMMIAAGRSKVTLEGGTHNPMAPPFDFLLKSYLPLVNRLGPRIGAILHRYGFFPAGGGCFAVEVEPAAALGRLELLGRGQVVSRRVRALVARLPEHIGRRECDTIAAQTGWDASCFSIDRVDSSPGPGNVVMIDLESSSHTEVFTGFGQRGVRAEAVASAALGEVNRYLRAGVPVGEHLADQILLPLAIAAWRGTGGGAFRTLDLSAHAKTHLEIIKTFLGVEATVVQHGADDVEVRIEPVGEGPQAN